ncbi:MAG: NifB/NifX family molybdenum-iron cluster-binding protein [Candidatus Izemoplasma sp.]|nr:NifB/NifX family molybdenum-iron cluster-binding protein [Candidatus Izemoplasma sp.]
MRYRKKRFARRLSATRDYQPVSSQQSKLPTQHITLDEFEAMRLCDIEQMSQIDAAKSMHVSRATIQRLLSDGRKKLLEAILHNEAFQIDNTTHHIQLKGENNMGTEHKTHKIIAFPTEDRQTVGGHFGHSKEFALFTVNKHTLEETNYITPPPHQPGVIPTFLRDQNVDVIITGNMGQRAITLFKHNNIDVILGAQGDITTNLEEYLGGTLVSSQKSCGHHDHHHHHGHHHHE